MTYHHNLIKYEIILVWLCVYLHEEKTRLSNVFINGFQIPTFWHGRDTVSPGEYLGYFVQSCGQDAQIELYLLLFVSMVKVILVSI